MKTTTEKYLNNQNYSKLVNTIESLMHQADFAPSEIREACILACTRYELRTLKRAELPPKEAYALDILHNFSHSVQEAYNFRTEYLSYPARNGMATMEKRFGGV